VGWVGVVGVVLARYETGLVLYETRRKENEEKKWRLWDSNQNFKLSKIKTMSPYHGNHGATCFDRSARIVDNFNSLF